MPAVGERTETIEWLRELPGFERRDALEEILVAEFRAALMMTDDEPLSTSSSFFELGCTSLLLVEVKQRLETLLGHGISANAVFNRPTVERLLEHLTDDVLLEVFDRRPRS
jgi:acyl carrier protein